MSKITDLDQNLVGGNDTRNLVGDTSFTVEPLELKAKSVLQILKQFRGYILEHSVKGDTGDTGLSVIGVSLTLTSSESTGNTYKMTCTLSDMSTINAGTFFVPKGDKGDTGDTGATGNGIASIVKTGTSGLVDTYTINYTNGTTTTFTVKNGQDGTGTEIYVNGVAVSSVSFSSDPQTQITNLENNKQDKIDSSHKLSADLLEDGTTNKVFTATEQSKLSGIESGAEVNVQPDWNQSNSSADDFIKNKPTIPSTTSSVTQDSPDALTSGGAYTALTGKQDTLTFDNEPTENSTNPVKSGGVYTALAKISNYSTNEVAIGKWIDNSTIYRKVFSFNADNNNQWHDLVNVSSLNIKWVVKLYGSQFNNSDKVFALPVAEGSYYRNICYNTINKTIQTINNGYEYGNGYIVIEYTKN